MKQGTAVPSVIIPEWHTSYLEDKCLTARDRMFAGRENRLTIDELRDGVRVTATSWVGVVRLEGFEIQVIPKLAGDNLGLARLIDYISDLGVLKRSIGVFKLHSSGASLLDLIAMLFAEACEKLVQTGLLSDYVQREGDLATVRGRILADRQVLRRFGRVDRIECRYDEYEGDILENQILAATLAVAAPRVGNEKVRAKLRRLQAIFDGVCKVKGFRPGEVRPLLVYHRLNENYREAHDLAWLLLDALGVEDVFQPGSTRCFAFLLDMNHLFERFLYRWVNELLRKTTYHVSYQQGQSSIIWDATLSRPYSRVIPDILLELDGQSGRVRLAIDAKYKKYDQRRLAPGDVYQLFLYAYTFGSQAKENKPYSSVMIYPSSSPGWAEGELQINGNAGATGARVRVIGLHIPTALDEAADGFNGPVSQAFKGMIGDLMCIR